MDGAQPGGDVAPGILGIGRHQVEDRPDLLCLAADHAHPGRRDVGLVELDLQAQPLQHRLLRGVLPLIAGRGGVQGRDGPADVRDLIGQPAGRVVAPRVVVTANPKDRLRSRDNARRTHPRSDPRWCRPGGWSA